MPRYFFHIRDGDDFIEDIEGAELSDAVSVREEAIKAAREMLAQRVLAGEVVNGRIFEIVDERERLIEALPFKSVLKLTDD